MNNRDAPVALIPAAGSASRLPGIVGSKEMLTVATARGDAHIPALQYLLSRLSEAGLSRAIVITSPKKVDILEFVASAREESLDIDVELVSNSPSVPYTLLRAARRFERENVLIVLPDIVFYPRYAPADLLSAWRDCEADVLLGAFPTDRPEKVDIVETASDGRMTGIRIKDGSAAGGCAWIMALWNPAFTRYLVEWHRTIQACSKEPQLGDAFNDAIAAGLQVDVKIFRPGGFLDIGTPEDLQRLREQGLPGPEL
jgi:glucose-1-phosphate thymidylyltransferase